MDDDTIARRQALQEINMRYRLPRDMSDIDVPALMVITGTGYNTVHYQSLVGSVIDHAYPSYAELTQWASLKDTTFNLLGVTVLYGHSGTDPRVIIPVINQLRKTKTYHLSVYVQPHYDLATQELRCTEFSLFPQETDVFVFAAFCDALHMAGLKTTRTRGYDDAFCYGFEISKGYQLL